MKNFIRVISVTSSIIFACSVVQAGDGTLQDPGPTTTTLYKAIQGAVSAGNAGTSNSQLGSLQVTQPSQNQAAGTSSSGNGLASIISYGMSAVLLGMAAKSMPTCCGAAGTCCPQSMMELMMGMQALSQGGASSGASGQNAGAAAVTSTGADGTPSSDTTTDPAIKAAQQEGQVAFSKAQAAASQVGIGLDPKNSAVTTPDGNTVDPNQLGEEGAATALGESPQDYKNTMATVASIDKNLMAKAKNHGFAFSGENGFSEGGGGSGSDSKSKQDAIAAAKRSIASAEKDKANFAGMTKNFKGELIGVSYDDIFQMMSRRYQEKIKHDNFLSPEAMPFTAQGPAALHSH